MLKDGVSGPEIAKKYGVSRQAVQQMRKKLEKRLAAVPDVTRSELSRNNIDTVYQLKNMNEHILEELKRCQRLIERQDVREQAMEKIQDDAETSKKEKTPAFLKKLQLMASASVNDILKIQSNIIAISGEVRRQVELQVKIYETIYNVTMVAEFQEEILNLLKEVDPALRDEAIKKLKQRRSMRGLVRMNP